MIEISGVEIIRVSKEGIHGIDWFIDFSNIVVREGFSGEITYVEGYFKIIFFLNIEDYAFVFRNNNKNAKDISEPYNRVMSLALRLADYGIKIKNENI